MQVCGCPVEGSGRRYIVCNTRAAADMVAVYARPDLYAQLPGVDGECQAGFCHKHWYSSTSSCTVNAPDPVIEAMHPPRAAA